MSVPSKKTATVIGIMIQPQFSIGFSMSMRDRNSDRQRARTKDRQSLYPGWGAWGLPELRCERGLAGSWPGEGSPESLGSCESSDAKAWEWERIWFKISGAESCDNYTCLPTHEPCPALSSLSSFLFAFESSRRIFLAMWPSPGQWDAKIPLFEGLLQ